MSKDDSKKKKTSIEKALLGAIIGTAIGSAVGMSIAPKKGSETRSVIKEKGKNLSKDVLEVGQLTRETTTGLFKLMKNLLFKKKGTKKKKTDTAFMRQIPNEMDSMPEEYVD
jgi:gas vesicle protein